MFSKKALLFDLDGTLVDTAPDLGAAANYVMSQINYQPISDENIRKAAGLGGLALIKQAISKGGSLKKGANRNDETLAPKAEDLLALFLNYYKQHIADKSVLYPGIMDCLTTARKAGYKIAIVTNKPEDLARKLIHNLGMANMIDHLIGGDTTPYPKPHPAPLGAAISALNCDHAIMIGDSDADWGAAKAKNIPFIAAMYGYGPLNIGSKTQLQLQAENSSADNPQALVLHSLDLGSAVTRIAEIYWKDAASASL